VEEHFYSQPESDAEKRVKEPNPLRSLFNKVPKEFLPLASIVVLLLGLVAGRVLVQRIQELREEAATAAVDLSFQPSDVTVNPGGQFTLNMVIDTNGLKATAADIEVTFDSSRLQAVSIAPGPNNFFKISGVSGSPDVLKSGTVYNPGSGTGNAKIIIGTGPTNAGKNGTGVLALVTFQAKNNTGTTNVNISSNTLVASLTTADNNAVASRQGAFVNIQANQPTSTPQPTNTPNPTNTPGVSNCNTCYNFNSSGDGLVDVQDILFVANRWNASSGSGDYNVIYDVYCSGGQPDGTINILDIQTVANRWNTASCTP
jgi:hypothetical protein